ncbi:MAG: S8 family serine peptidase [Gammaproteobacteria bacterium]
MKTHFLHRSSLLIALVGLLSLLGTPLQAQAASPTLLPKLSPVLRALYLGKIPFQMGHATTLASPASIGGLIARPSTACTFDARPLGTFTPMVNSCGDTLVWIVPDSRGSVLLSSLADLGAQKIQTATWTSMIQAWIPVSKLPMLAELPGVAFVRNPLYVHTMNLPRRLAPRGVPISPTGQAPIQALAMQSEALNKAGINGQGVNVGLISSGAYYYSFYASEGFLPNNVYFAYPPSGDQGADEGSWMMQIVYQDAPDANLGFCSGVQSSYDIPGCAQDLITQFGANIVSDDLGIIPTFYFPMTDAIGYEALMKAYPNVLFFTSAGNWGNTVDGQDGFYQAGYVPTTATVNGVSQTVEDFGKAVGDASNPFNEFALPPGYGVELIIGWSDNPTENATTGACPSTNNAFNLELVEPTGTSTAGAPLAESGPSNSASSSGLVINTNCPSIGLVYTNTGSTTLTVSPVIQAVSTPNTTNLNFKLIASIVSNNGSGSFPLTYYTDGSAGADRDFPGQSKSNLLEAAAVVPFGTNPPGFPIEFFSSSGPYTLSWNCNAAETSCTAITPPDNSEVPDIAAPDEDIVNMGGFMQGFYGTSAASPGAASVAALLLSAGVSSKSIPSILEKTAAQQSGSGWNGIYGYGLVDALQAAIASVPPTATITDPANPEVTVGQAVTFAGYCSTAIGSNESDFTANWSFSNGKTATGYFPGAISFSKPGTYTAEMTCSNLAGVTSKPASLSVAVAPSPGGGGGIGGFGPLGLIVLGFFTFSVTLRTKRKNTI